MLFLSNTDFTPRPFSLNIKGLSPLGLFLGQGNQGLEICIFSSQLKPTSGMLQQAFKDRKAGRASPVLIVVIYNKGVYLGEKDTPLTEQQITKLRIHTSRQKSY